MRLALLFLCTLAVTGCVRHLGAPEGEPPERLSESSMVSANCEFMSAFSCAFGLPITSQIFSS